MFDHKHACVRYTQTVSFLEEFLWWMKPHGLILETRDALLTKIQLEPCVFPFPGHTRMQGNRGAWYD